jgi:ABC-type transport system involved in multi-copper enzyme maturation permease subunit
MMARMLLWKDLLLLRETFKAAAALLIISYAFAGLLVFMGETGDFSWSKVIAGGASLARFTSLLISALVGGHLYGREREDGSEQFLLQLPVRPGAIVASKLVVALGALATVWLVSMLLMLGGMGGMGIDTDTQFRVLQAMLPFATAGLMAFGSAWLASYFVPSAVGAAFVGIIAVLPAYPLHLCYAHFAGLERTAGDTGGMALVMFVLGTTAAATAAWLFTSQHVQQRCLKKAPDGATAREFAANMEAFTPFRAVVWKDYRLMKIPVGLGLVLLVLPSGIGCASFLFSAEWPSYLAGASVISMAIGALVMPFWAAQIMSGEHTAQTFQFLAYLPIPLRDIAKSRLCIALGPALLATGFSVGTLLVAQHAMQGKPAFDAAFTWDDWIGNGFIVMGLGLANASLIAFAVSWLLAAHYLRPTLAIVAGIIMVPLSITAWGATSTMFMESGSHTPLLFVLLFTACAAIFQSLTLAGGVALLSKKRMC